MDFTYDEEQQALREAVRGLVGKAYDDFENRRQAVKADPGYSEKVWTQLAEMGVLGLPFEEQYGGMGAPERSRSASWRRSSAGCSCLSRS